MHLKGEHSAILSTFIKLPFVIKIFVCIFVWPFYMFYCNKKFPAKGLMIYCSIEELFEKFLQRLEEDYNVEDYTGNLVEQVW